MTMPINVAQYISNESARQSAPRFPMILAYEVANNPEMERDHRAFHIRPGNVFWV